MSKVKTLEASTAQEHATKHAGWPNCCMQLRWSFWQPQLITLTNYFYLCYADGKMPMVYLNYLISSDLNQVIKT